MPVPVKSKLRTAVYVGMALLSLVIFSGGVLPLLMHDQRNLKLLTLYFGLLGGAPLLLMRTKFFDKLVTTGAGYQHSFAATHAVASRLLVVLMIVAGSLIAWRASTVGLPGWKGGFLLIYGWGLFCAAGWVLRAPRFMLQERK
jgi:hypothetical protein